MSNLTFFLENVEFADNHNKHLAPKIIEGHFIKHISQIYKSAQSGTNLEF